MIPPRNTSNKLVPPTKVFQSLIQSWPLAVALIRRAILTRYRGSFLGVAWAVASPVMRLIIYTFVFGTIFGVQWPHEHGDTLSFAALLFSGLVCHAFAAEVLLQASTIITSNQQYVKKVIFPLEILPWVVVLSALFHLVVSTGVLLTYLFIIEREMSWTVLFVPLPFLALTLMMLSLAWLISSVAVFVRDVSQVIELASMAMLFLSPVFFPLTALPEQLQPFLYLNPITFIVQEVRGVMLFGQLPNIGGLVIYSALAGVGCWLSLSLFQRLRRGFSDVM